MKNQAWELPNYRMFTISFLGATDTRGARLKISEKARYNDQKTQSKTFSYCYKTGCIQQQAYNILTENGFKIVSRASDKDNYYFHVDSWGEDFKEIKDIK